MRHLRQQGFDVSRMVWRCLFWRVPMRCARRAVLYGMLSIASVSAAQVEDVTPAFPTVASEVEVAHDGTTPATFVEALDNTTDPDAGRVASPVTPTAAGMPGSGEEVVLSADAGQTDEHAANTVSVSGSVVADGSQENGDFAKADATAAHTQAGAAEGEDFAEGIDEGWIRSPSEVWEEVKERNRVNLPDACRVEYGGRWFDRTQRVISVTACSPAVWFDQFFGDKRDDESIPGTTLRIVTGVDSTTEDDVFFSTSYRIKTHLPNVERKLRLIITNQDELDDDALSLEQQLASDAEAQTSTTQAALQWMLQKGAAYNVSFDVALDSEIKTILTLRYRYRKAFWDDYTFRFSNRLFWRDTRGTGTIAQFELDRRLTSSLLLRFSERLKFTEEDKDEGRIFWRDGIALAQRIDNRRGVVYSVGRNGVIDPEYRTDAYRLSVRYRQNIFRPWLFYELEKYTVWPLELGYRDVQGVAFRLETYFGIIND